MTQVLLGLAFLVAGEMKLAMSVDAFALTAATWAADVPEPQFRFIGVVEVFGAIGVTAPAATRVYPLLTPLAAAGLFTVMFLTGTMHVFDGEAGVVVMNLVPGAMAAFVAWGRAPKQPIEKR